MSSMKHTPEIQNPLTPSSLIVGLYLGGPNTFYCVAYRADLGVLPKPLLQTQFKYIVLVEKQNHPNHIRLHLIFSKKDQIAFAGNNSTGLLFTKYHEISPPLQFSHPKLLCFSFGTPSLGSPLVSLDTAIYRVRWGANDIFSHCGCSSVGHLMIEGFGQLVVSL